MSAARFTPPPGMAECPQCDPCSPEMDEGGRPYACYCCGDTGWISLEAAAEIQREREEAVRQHPPVRIPRPDAGRLHYGYSTLDDDDIPF